MRKNAFFASLGVGEGAMRKEAVGRKDGGRGLKRPRVRRGCARTGLGEHSQSPPVVACHYPVARAALLCLCRDVEEEWLLRGMAGLHVRNHRNDCATGRPEPRVPHPLIDVKALDPRIAVYSFGILTVPRLHPAPVSRPTVFLFQHCRCPDRGKPARAVPCSGSASSRSQACSR